MEIKSFIISLTNARDTNSHCSYYGVSRRCGRKTIDFRKRFEEGRKGKHTHTHTNSKLK